jgi:serine/threonine protein kinase
MMERTIFLSALEMEDADARSAYLDAACAGDEKLRADVEALLRAHESAGSFLDATTIDQVTAADQSLAFLAPPQEPGALGRLDHFEVLEVVGRGGMGVVLKTWDTKLRRVVALKVLAPHLAASAAARGQFVREAQAAAAIRDDHVVVVHAVEGDRPVPYLVMDYIAGTTLEQRLQRGGPPPLAQIVRIGYEIACGLAAAHQAGLVHRDAKPANILLEDPDNRVKLTDFGLAGLAEDFAVSGGGVTGTPMYMSPEQARGDPLDARSDLFSLGSVLYTLCTARAPFESGPTEAVLREVQGATPTPICALNPEIPPWLEALIGKLHAKDPRDRCASAREIADFLGRHLVLYGAFTPITPR